MAEERRAAGEGGYRFGPFVLDLDRFEVRAGDERIDLQPKVLAVLRLLVESAPRTVPKEEILDTVWADVVTGDEVLTKAISQARQALGRAAPDQEVIRTVRGRGYGLALPVAPLTAARPDPHPRDAELGAAEGKRGPDAGSAAEPQGAALAPGVAPLPARAPGEAPATGGARDGKDRPLLQGSQEGKDRPLLQGSQEGKDRPLLQRPLLRSPLLVAGVVAGACLAVLLAAAIYLAIPVPLPYSPAGDDAVPVASTSSLAVLAFADLSPGADHAYLARGISEDLIAALARHPELQVAARTSAFALGADPLPAQEVARRLGVGSVVEGSVRVAGGRLRVSAQLVRCSDGFALWSERFERPLDDVLQVQDEIAAAIARELEARLVPAVRGPARPGQVQAFLLSRRARAAMLTRSREGMEEAITLYEQAVGLSPDLAEAHAGLAAALAFRWGSFSAEPRTSPLLERAEHHARRALELDPESVAGTRELAELLWLRQRDWEGAVRGFERTLALNPSDSEALTAFASLEMKRGRFDEAMALLQRALSIDPLRAGVHQMLGRLHFYRTEYDAALRALHRSFDLTPGPEIPSLLSKAYGRKGMDRESGEALLLHFSPGSRPFLRVLVRSLGTVGFLRFMMDVVQWRTGSRCGTDPWTGSHVFAYTGEVDRMLECLERAEQRHLWYVRVEPAFDPYRRDPRFAALLERAGFGEAAEGAH